MSTHFVLSSSYTKVPVRLIRHYDLHFLSSLPLPSKTSTSSTSTKSSTKSRSLLRTGENRVCKRHFSSQSGSVSNDESHKTERSIVSNEVNLNQSTIGRKQIVIDPSTVKRVFYFDSLTFMKNLEKKGFSREQAEGITEGFIEVIESTIDYQTQSMVTKPQQEIKMQQLMAEVAAIKKDMVILQKSEFTSLQHDTEKQRLELKMMKDSIDDEIQKIKGKVTLDINLERGRAIEAHADSEKEMNKLHNKIDTGMANLRTMFEQYRNDVFKYAGGTVLTCASISLGLIRLWS